MTDRSHSVGFGKLQKFSITEAAKMNKIVCIVTSGNPENKRFNYTEVSEKLRGLLEAHGATVLFAEDAKDGIKKLEEDAAARRREKVPHGGMYVAYISAYYCTEALEMAKVYSPRIRFVVYSVGLAPMNMPTFAFRGMLTQATLHAIFV